MKSMRLMAGASLLTCGILLAACGGGGVNSTPTPTPGTPTPTPPAPVSPKMSDAMSADVEFATVGSNSNRAMEVSQHELGAGSPSIKFDAATDTVILAFKDAVSVHHLLVGTRADKPFAQDLLVEEGPVGAPTFVFKTSTPTVQGVPLSYMRFGSVDDWAGYTSPGGAIIGHRFFFGYPTAASAMPKSGTASYNTVVDGVILSPQFYRLNGAGQFSADFSTGALTTQIEGKGQGLSDPTQLIDLGVFNGTGNIISGGPKFSGTFKEGSSTYGDFVGAFFGPNAQEMGFHFVIEKDGTSVVGNVAGNKR